MEATRRLEIELPEDVADAVLARVESGQFASESEVVQAGLELLDEQGEPLEDWVREGLAAAYDEWKANPSGGVPIEEVSARLDKERSRRRAKA